MRNKFWVIYNRMKALYPTHLLVKLSMYLLD